MQMAKLEDEAMTAAASGAVTGAVGEAAGAVVISGASVGMEEGALVSGVLVTLLIGVISPGPGTGALVSVCAVTRLIDTKNNPKKIKADAWKLLP